MPTNNPTNVYATGDGVTKTYSIPFPYLDPAHVKVTVDGVAVSFTFTSPGTVELATAPAVGTTIRLYRETVKNPLVVWADGAVILGKDLNASSRQALYIAEEAHDYTEAIAATASAAAVAGVNAAVAALATSIADTIRTEVDAEIAAAAVAAAAGKADAIHAHEIGDVTGLTTALADKADAAATTTALSGKEPADANIVKANATKELTVGYTAASYDAGSKSSGTFTPDPTLRNVQHFTNDGAFTLAPPASGPSLVLDQTNGATAGTITRSGFTKVTGDTLTTTNGHKFRHFITIGNGGSHCHTQALQ